MAGLPVLQKGTERTQIQEARLADEHNRILVSALPVFIEHVHYL
jgi:hypothetical protein